MSDLNPRPSSGEVGLFELTKFEQRWNRPREEMSGNARSEFAARQTTIIAQIGTGEICVADATNTLDELADEILRRQRKAYIAKHVPGEFMQPLDRTKMENPYATDQVLKWWAWDGGADGEPSDRYCESLSKGILAFGQTGRGKTRSILAALSAFYLENGPRQAFEFVRMVDLTAQVRLLAPRRGDELEEYIELLSLVPVLFLDDLHQAKLTPRIAEELFRIIDTRTNSGGLLPLFVSCQMPGAQLVQKMAGDNPELRPTAEAIVRRLRDACHPVDFDAKPA